jgi:uncharacterized protein YcbK (DUF882 family)
MERGKLARSFDWKEFTKSDVAKAHHINNEIVDWEVRDNIKALVDNVLQPLRDAWGGPLFINSGFRCKELNELVGGVETSQHRFGMAADVGVTDPYALAKLAKRLGIVWDQMILYPSFLHISYRRDGENRGQLLYNKRWKGSKDL